MPFKLEKEKVAINNNTSVQSTQILLEEDVIVPDSKPDIDFIIRAFGIPFIETVKPGDGKVDIAGEVLIDVLYQSKNSDVPLHNVTTSMAIDESINIDGVDKNSNIALKLDMQSLDFNVINDRKFNIKTILNAYVENIEETEVEVVKNISDAENIQMKTGKISVTNVVENKRDRFNIKEELAIPAGKPNIREVLQTNISIADKSVKPMDGRVSVNGKLLVSTMYVGDNDESIIEVVDYEIPFNGYIESKNVLEDMLVKSNLALNQKKVRVLQNDDGEDRILDLEAVVGADLKVMDNREIEVIEDAYSLESPLEIAREAFSYQAVKGKNEARVTHVENIRLDENDNDIMQIQKVWGTVSLEDVAIEEDKIIVSGVINLEVMYIVNNDNEPVKTAYYSIPFEHEIESKGLKSGMSADVTAQISDTIFNMLTNNELEVRTDINFEALVSENNEGTIITEINISDEGSNINSVASIIIYVVQKGDTLWNIAKKYNNTVDDIVEINDIENPDLIYPGQRLLILKKVVE